MDAATLPPLPSVSWKLDVPGVPVKLVPRAADKFTQSAQACCVAGHDSGGIKRRNDAAYDSNFENADLGRRVHAWPPRSRKTAQGTACRVIMELCNHPVHPPKCHPSPPKYERLDGLIRRPYYQGLLAAEHFAGGGAWVPVDCNLAGRRKALLGRISKSGSRPTARACGTHRLWAGGACARGGVLPHCG
jgi:hypothetical protein